MVQTGISTYLPQISRNYIFVHASISYQLQDIIVHSETHDSLYSPPRVLVVFVRNAEMLIFLYLFVKSHQESRCERLAQSPCD